jgi:uncharacterized Ntn-hydrolase superfamily protein
VTFSLVGRCARTGMLGVAVSSSSPAVAARCAHVRAGVGAVASQNVTDPRLGPRILDGLADGRAPAAVIASLEGEAGIEWRQLTAVGADGRTAARSGARTLGRHGAAEGADCVGAGNLLAADDVPAAMVEEFGRDPSAHLAERLVRGLAAGLAAGGEEGPVRSAGVMVCGAEAWPSTDLRVDWHDTPIDELLDLWHMWAPQEADYVTRAIDPDAAPGFGVPGE